MDDDKEQELRNIMSVPAFHPDEVTKLGYPPDLCKTLIGNFFGTQLMEYINAITSAVESND